MLARKTELVIDLSIRTLKPPSAKLLVSDKRKDITVCTFYVIYIGKIYI